MYNLGKKNLAASSKVASLFNVATTGNLHHIIFYTLLNRIRSNKNMSRPRWYSSLSKPK
jgi:hypothetical protein